MGQHHPSGAASVFETELKDFTTQYKLSRRETDIVLALVRNITNSEDVAKNLGISTHTVNNHLKSIFEKTSTKSKTEILSTFLKFAAERMSQKTLFFRRPRVLILDREQVVVDFIANGLSERGIKAFAFTDLEKANDAIISLNIDVIVCDEHLTDSEGTPIVSKVRHNFRCWPHFILTTNNPELTVEECYDQGASGYIVKPIDLDKLFKLIVSDLNDDQPRVGDKNTDLVTNSDTPLVINTNSIGYGGAFIAMDGSALRRSKLTIGSYVNLSVSPRQTQPAMNIKGQVVWKRTQLEQGLETGVGVRFVDINERDLVELHTVLTEFDTSSFIPIGRSSSEASGNRPENLI